MIFRGSLITHPNVATLLTDIGYDVIKRLVPFVVYMDRKDDIVLPDVYIVMSYDDCQHMLKLLHPKLLHGCDSISGEIKNQHLAMVNINIVNDVFHVCVNISNVEQNNKNKRISISGKIKFPSIIRRGLKIFKNSKISEWLNCAMKFKTNPDVCDIFFQLFKYGTIEYI